MGRRRADRRRQERIMPRDISSSDEEGDSRLRGPRVFDHSDDEPEGIVGEDEDIDSDEAFGEDDEYEMGQMSGRYTSRKPEKYNDNNEGDEEDDMNEEDEDEDEEDGEDMVALSNLLDEAPEDEEPGSGSEEENDGQNGKYHEDDLDDTDWGAIWTKKRAHHDDELVPQKRRPARTERTEAVHESTDAAGGGAKLRLEDLMAHGSGASLQNVQALTEKRNAIGQQPVASKRGGGVLHAPLPGIVQDRLDRVEAYKLSREEVEGWAPTIKRIREAEHLSFPLQPPAQPPAPSNAGLTASFTPSNEMERSVAALLQDGGLTEKQVAEQEGLALRAMDPAEATQRQADLRRMRELMFRAEQKARRANKIKSKTYRRIHRRERERLQQQQREEAKGAADQDSDGDLDEEERFQAAKERARERATLRHKNTGKWAKFHASRHDDASTDARLAVEEQLRRGDELRKRIHAAGDDDDESIGSMDSTNEQEAVAFDELETFARREAEQDARDEAELEASGKKGKSVFHMKFMKDASDRQKRATQETIESLRNEIAHAAADHDDDHDVNEDAWTDSNRDAMGAASTGRAMYGKGFATKSVQAPLVHVPARPTNPFHTGGSNPWLQSNASMAGGGHSAGASRQTPQVLIGKDSRAASRSVHRTERHASRGSDSRALAADDATLDIDPTAQLETAASEDEDDPEPVEVTRHASRGKRGRGQRHVSMQRDLVAEAFAGDDVALDFAKEKRAAIKADAPREEDTTLPGWGSWGGKGVRRKPKNPALIKKIGGLDPAKRKDFGMDNVIVNERLDKKAAKYKAQDLPFPYTSAAQYEAAMRTPIGAEWNTRTQHQRMTMPRVTTKMGQRIDPIRTYDRGMGHD